MLQIKLQIKTRLQSRNEWSYISLHLPKFLCFLILCKVEDFSIFCRSSDDRYIFTGALETDIEQKNRGAENEQVEVHRCPFEVLDNGIKVEHLVEGNAKAKVASKGKQVSLNILTYIIQPLFYCKSILSTNTSLMHMFNLSLVGWYHLIKVISILFSPYCCLLFNLRQHLGLPHNFHMPDPLPKLKEQTI